jgi:hypothetical protein
MSGVFRIFDWAERDRGRGTLPAELAALRADPTREFDHAGQAALERGLITKNGVEV